MLSREFSCNPLDESSYRRHFFHFGPRNENIPCKFPDKQGIWYREWFAVDCHLHHVFPPHKRFYGICAQRGAVGVIRLAVLTGEAGMKRVKAMISVVFSVRYFVGPLRGSDETQELAERIKSQTIPLGMGEFLLSKFILELYQLEETIKSDDKPAFVIPRTNAYKAGKKALKISDKAVFFKTEALKLMGVYFWVIGKQRKAIKWWRKTIKEGTRLNDRLELSEPILRWASACLRPKASLKNWMASRQRSILKRPGQCLKRWTFSGTWMNWRSSGYRWEPD